MGAAFGKSQGSQRPTAMGSLLQASCYGSTVPKIYGQTQSPLLAIWAAHLRQGGSVKKFKQMKKGITAYVENIDFLLGHTPIMGVLRLYVNGTPFPLAFTSQSFGLAASLAVTDAHFYAVTAVSLVQDYSFTVNDFGGQGSQVLAGSYEIPLWNELEQGPDSTGPSCYRNWPYSYRWKPGYGNTVYFDSHANIFGGTIKIYYAQLMAATSYQPPATKLRLAFEAELGNGTEYADAPSPFNGQQIIYPHFAGIGSSDIDLGSSGAIPQILPEVRGKWGIYPAGDCDFADIIEDVFKSGLAQASVDSTTPFTQMEAGLSSYNLPGCLQLKVASGFVDIPPMMYNMPNTAGNYLVAVATGDGALSISDTAGNTWTPLLAGGSSSQVWYAKALGGPNTVSLSEAGAPDRALYVTPPVPVPAGQSLLWIFPGTDGGTAGSDCTVATSARGGGFGLIGGGPFTTPATMAFAGFVLPTLPVGAVIESVYGVCYVSEDSVGGTVDGIHYGFVSCASLDILNSPPGQYQQVLGEADIATWAPSFWCQCTTVPPHGTVFLGPLAQSFAVAEIAIAVYYTGGNPTAGRGLAIAEVAGVDTLDATFDVSASGSGSVASTVLPGFPSYLLALPLYPNGDAPVDAKSFGWDHVTPGNFYANSPTAFQIHEKTVRSPGTYAFSSPGTPGFLTMLSFKASQAPSYPRPLGDFIDLPSLDTVRAQCRANGLWGSLSMNTQSAASDWLKTLYAAANAAPVFLGSKLYSYPYSEVSAAGNGCLYTAPTASGPVFALDADNGDFVGADGTPKVSTASRIQLPNVLQMQCISRDTDYNQVVVQQPDAVSIALWGERKADPVVNNAIQDASIARQLLAIQVRRNQYGGDTWSFTASAKWSLLSPMDLVTLTDRLQNIVAVPVRITSYTEQQDGSFEAQAEPFVYGVCAPTPLTATVPSHNPPGTGETAGDVNPPVIFEPTTRLAGNLPQAQLWVVVSSPSAQYGGAQVYISTDGGASYNPVGDPLIGSAITGVTTADWPAAPDPDTTNNLAIDLTESNGALLSYLASDRDHFLYPCYVAGGGAYPINYELLAYNAATLTGANLFTLEATGAGNELRRGVFGAPSLAVGVDHPAASRFAFLPPTGLGILKLNMDPTWIGETLYFKIVSFNTFGGATQSLGDVIAYSYTPGGASDTIASQSFQVNGV